MVKFMDILVLNWAEVFGDFKMVGFILCFIAVSAFLPLLKHGDVEVNCEPKEKETRFFFLLALECE